MTIPVNRRRFALGLLFFLPGLTIASWVTRTPAIRDLVDATTAQMGLVLFGLSVGSMIGILASGTLVARFSTRPVIFAGIGGVIASMPTIGVGAALGSAVLVAAGLFLFGVGMGSSEVAMNIEGAEVEQLLGRSFLPLLHGFFSLGTVVGALAGIAFTATDFPVLWHLIIIGAVSILAWALAMPHVARGTGIRQPTASAGTRRRWAGLDRSLLPIGIVILAMALAEGTANDWLPLVMVDGHGLDPAFGSAVFAAFAAAMTAGRFLGGSFVNRFGQAKVLTASALFGAAGLGLVAFSDSQIVAAAAVLLWGFGASMGFPLAISAAGGDHPDASARVAFVATMGYVAFLVGPPVLGLVGEEHGLRNALIIPLVFVVAAALVAPRVGRATDAGRPHGRSARDEEPQPAGQSNHSL
ncbi:MFS transporter [Pseudarthrobacter chlorophenolicus]|uniref:MFS transporter n=1 Tax=Pseudarthrobacter chlorophenolicus TaxID=85085 RepID=UPI0009E49839|nr:MFS transporter [Pseudarthrobacter chlorophenolicus]